ncbi:MAG: hypothetical protein H6512_01665 [Acidimicrobiia bacterium]|nr:hypothetical protein [Acidimicrobiia bacterium]
MVATHLDCTSGILDRRPRRRCSNSKTSNSPPERSPRSPRPTTKPSFRGTGTIRGDSTVYGYELTIINKGDSRELTDYYKIKIYAPGQTAPTIVIKGPVRRRDKITTT